MVEKFWHEDEQLTVLDNKELTKGLVKTTKALINSVKAMDTMLEILKANEQRLKALEAKNNV